MKDRIDSFTIEEWLNERNIIKLCEQEKIKKILNINNINRIFKVHESEYPGYIVADKYKCISQFVTKDGYNINTGDIWISNDVMCKNVCIEFTRWLIDDSEFSLSNYYIYCHNLPYDEYRYNKIHLADFLKEYKPMCKIHNEGPSANVVKLVTSIEV